MTQITSRCQEPMTVNSDEDVLRQVLYNIDKFLAGTINSQELFTYMYVISRARLDIQTQKEIKKTS